MRLDAHAGREQVEPRAVAVGVVARREDDVVARREEGAHPRVRALGEPLRQLVPRRVWAGRDSHLVVVHGQDHARYAPRTCALHLSMRSKQSRSREPPLVANNT